MERRLETELIAKGAEANLYLTEWYGQKVVLKRRVKKSYRLDVLDQKTRRFRTIHEAQLIHDAKVMGIPTPTIFTVDLADFTIVMEYISGSRLKETIDYMSKDSRSTICRIVGRQVGILHSGNIIHGDLTTSNMILRGNKVYFIDFGLSMYSSSTEDRGVDLHLMRRAFNSTHHRYVDEYFNSVVAGYRDKVEDDESNDVIRKVREIEKRGRYFAER